MTKVTVTTKWPAAFDLYEIAVDGPRGREVLSLAYGDVEEAKSYGAGGLLDLVAENCGSSAIGNLEGAAANGWIVELDGAEVPATLLAGMFSAAPPTP